MNREVNIWFRISQLVSLAMVVLIFSISIVQTFHAHQDDHHSIKTGTEYTQVIEKCQICDFLSHQQKNEYLTSCQEILQLPFSFSVDENIGQSENFYKFSIPGFTNKGPPF